MTTNEPKKLTSPNLRSRKRDPRTGRLLPRNCQLYLAGHTPHWIQANRSAGQPHRSGKLVAVEGPVITVTFGDEVKDYRNCDPDRLLEIVGIGHRVRVCERYVIMRTQHDYVFCIADAYEPWVPCDYSPLASASPDELAERIRTHGGFTVPGSEILKHLSRESDR